MSDAWVEVKSTKSASEYWLASGTVTFTLRGTDSPTATLAFDFANARSEKDAIQKAANLLLAVAREFEAQAQRYLK